MKKMKTSTKLFAILGLALITLVTGEIVVAGRMMTDIRTIKEAELAGELNTSIEKSLKTYKQVPMGAFCRINIENGAYVQILKSDRYAVYRSHYDRNSLRINIQGDELHIYPKSASNRRNRNTPVFVLMPEKPEVRISGSKWEKPRFEIRGFDCHSEQSEKP